jgi:hypothetical protein
VEAELPDDQEAERGDRPDLLHTDLLEGDLQIRVVEQPQPGAQQHRCHIDVQLVGEPARRTCWTTLAPSTWTTRGPAAAFALAIAEATPSVTNVKVRCSSCLGMTGGGVWVSTKMGTWNS